MQKIALAWTGKPYAGKGTLNELTEQTIKRLAALHGIAVRVSQHRYSDILRETLALWDIKSYRENTQLLARIMREFRKDALSHAVKIRLEQDPADIVSIDGMRWITDEDKFRDSFMERGLIVYVQADPAIRFERAKYRARDQAEATLTWEQFLQEDRAENEIFIDEIGRRADCTIHNNIGITKEELAAQIPKMQTDVERLCTEKILPLIIG